MDSGSSASFRTNKYLKLLPISRPFSSTPHPQGLLSTYLASHLRALLVNYLLPDISLLWFLSLNSTFRYHPYLQSLPPFPLDSSFIVIKIANVSLHSLSISLNSWLQGKTINLKPSPTTQVSKIGSCYGICIQQLLVLEVFIYHFLQLLSITYTIFCLPHCCDKSTSGSLLSNIEDFNAYLFLFYISALQSIW